MKTQPRTNEPAPTPGDSLLRFPEVKRRVGLGKTFIYRLIARGEFPAPIRLTERAVAWPASAIDRWIAERVAASVNEQPGGRGG